MPPDSGLQALDRRRICVYSPYDRTVLLYDPNFADAHYNLASLLEQIGDARAALQHLAAYPRVFEARE